MVHNLKAFGVHHHSAAKNQRAAVLGTEYLSQPNEIFLDGLAMNALRETGLDDEAESMCFKSADVWTQRFDEGHRDARHRVGVERKGDDDDFGFKKCRDNGFMLLDSIQIGANDVLAWC